MVKHSAHASRIKLCEAPLRVASYSTREDSWVYNLRSRRDEVCRYRVTRSETVTVGKGTSLELRNLLYQQVLLGKLRVKNREHRLGALAVSLPTISHLNRNVYLMEMIVLERGFRI